MDENMVDLEEEQYDDEFDDAEDEARHSFTVRGKTYIVRITKARLDLYEQRHRPIMASFIQNNGAFSAGELTSLLAYGLCEEGGSFVNPRQGAVMAERLLIASGYVAVYEAVVEALERDCGFLFKGAREKA